MRVLLTCEAAYSHLMPMVAPVARALREYGHQVAVATGPSMSDQLHQLGLPLLPLPRRLSVEEKMADPELVQRLGLSTEELAKPVTGASFGRLFAGESAVLGARDILAASAEFRPDLVIRENADLGGYLYAEKVGLPCVTLDASATSAVRDCGMLPWLNETRTELGLSTVPDTSTLSRDPWISWVPPSWYVPDAYTPVHRHYRAVEQPAPMLDAAVAVLPADRPLVLAALGSNVEVFGGEWLLPELVAALGRLPVTAVVALGARAAPADWTGPRPGNVHLVSFVQQNLLLPACDLFITHAGFGSVREALSAGVPTVSVPLGQDQPGNARRLAELGVGVGVPLPLADATTLADASHHVLTEPSYRYAARGLQRAYLGLPGPDDLVADLERLVA